VLKTKHRQTKHLKIARIAADDPPMNDHPPGGWHANPDGPGLRWWDGERWTDQIHHPPPPPDAGPRPNRPNPGRVAVAAAAAILVAAAVAAIALVSDGSDSENQREADLVAAQAAHSAEVTAEIYETENEGSSEGLTASALRKIEPTLPDDLEAAVTGDSSFRVTVPSEGGNSFTVSHDNGYIRLTCAQPGEGLCPVTGRWEP
jgi:Protein of unknown function (DUF2510)